MRTKTIKRHNCVAYRVSKLGHSDWTTLTVYPIYTSHQSLADMLSPQEVRAFHKMFEEADAELVAAGFLEPERSKR